MIFSRKRFSTKVRSKRSEKLAAKIYGGKVQPASGAINRLDLKGDVKSDTFLVDDKTTDAQSYQLKVETWRKLSSEAYRTARRPSMRVEFIDGPSLYILDELTFRQMLAVYNEHKPK